MSQNPPFFCVSGVKNSGKTSLILALMEVLKADFPKIGVIKHDGHDFIMDHPGTDTYRFGQMGAGKIAIFSPKKSVLMDNTPPAEDPAARARQFLAQMGDMDLVIIEGMKYSPYPKIEIVRKEISHQCVCCQDTLIAVASDTQVSNLREGIPLIPLWDISNIAAAARAYLQLKTSNPLQ